MCESAHFPRAAPGNVSSLLFPDYEDGMKDGGVTEAQFLIV